MGQSLLTIAAMMLLSVISLRMNAAIFLSQDTSQNSKFGLAAISLATSQIEEASRLAFDENSIDNPLSAVAYLTSSGLLGKETGESTPDLYDDLDDYNNYTTVDSSQISAVFNVWMRVSYVNGNALNSVSAVPTWHKKITVKVASPFMRDTISISSIFSYWTFR